MNILVITPSLRENRDMVGTLDRAGMTRNTYDVVRCGIGKASAAACTAAALTSPGRSYDAVAVVGFAAGSPGFAKGEIVMPNCARYHDCDVPDGFIPELTDPYPLAGSDDVTVFTGDSFISAHSATEIRRRFGAYKAIFDMEITAVAIAVKHVGKEIPVYAIKMISDIPERNDTEHSYDEFVDSHSDFSEILSRLEEINLP